MIGAGGQDGSYMCDWLLGQGYRVVAITRPATSWVHPRVAGDLNVIRCDVNDASMMSDVLAATRPREIYNFAAVTFGPDVWESPVSTARTATSAIAGLLDAVVRRSPESRIFQASSAWVFGLPTDYPQDESTPYAPVEPYGVGKAYGDQLIRAYRSRFDIFACSGVLYNHESPRRGERFLSRKVSKAVAAIKAGRQSSLSLASLDGVHDWGFAGDYVRAAWLMLQQDSCSDYVIATGVGHTVQDLVARAFRAADLDWEAHVSCSPDVQRPGPRTGILIGDSSAARKHLAWSPAVGFDQMIEMMVECDLQLVNPTE